MGAKTGSGSKGTANDTGKSGNASGDPDRGNRQSDKG